jgi:ankyrin repeat protein
VARFLRYTLASMAMLAAAQAFGANAQDVWIYVANDNASAVKELLAAGMDPNTKNDKGQPVIMQAVRDNAWNVFDVLAADPKTDVNEANASDETPLMYLAIQGQTERARKLIARGAKVNRLGWTPLHYAASRGKMDVARLLIADKAIINAVGPDGTSPLMMAGLSGSEEMTQLLLKAGADPTMRNLQGLSAADWAKSAKNDSLAAQLQQASDKVWAERDAMRAKAQGGAAAPAGAPAAAPGSVSPASPAMRGPGPAMPPTSAPSQPAPADNAVHGVQGVQTDPNLPTGN